MRIGVLFFALVTPLAASAAKLDRVEILGRSELPAKVEATFARQAGERGLEQIRRGIDSHGRTVYTAQIAGSDRTVEVAPSGRVLPNP
jgi:hypothetical protein